MTASYGSGDVTIAPNTVGNVAVSNVRPIPALTPRIGFDLSWTLQHQLRMGEGPPGRPFVLTDFPGELTVGPDNLFVGNFVRTASGHPIRSLSHVARQRSSVALNLDGHRLERLEEHRAAGGLLTMQMRLWPRVEMDDATIHAKVTEIRFQIPRDDWLAVVREFTGERIDLLEIRYHLTYASRFRPSLGVLQRAREAVDRGDFDAAVIQARKAVSLMAESFKGIDGGSLNDILSERLDDRHAKLYSGVITRAKEMGNITAHSAEAREYTRGEALFAIRLATILLEVVAGLVSDGTEGSD